MWQYPRTTCSPLRIHACDQAFSLRFFKIFSSGFRILDYVVTSSWRCQLQGPGSRNSTCDVYGWFNGKDEFERQQKIDIVKTNVWKITTRKFILSKFILLHERSFFGSEDDKQVFMTAE